MILLGTKCGCALLGDPLLDGDPAKFKTDAAAAKLAREKRCEPTMHDRVAERPRLRKYLRSKRRIQFNRQGIFRHYPELDR